MKRTSLVILILVLALSAVLAQRRYRGGFGGGGRFYGGGGGYYESFDNPRQIPEHGGLETPNWTNTSGFDKDVFTFVRVIRESGGPSGGPWWTDTPDSDLNLSFRLQQLTALKVNPDGKFLRLSDEHLFDYPMIYMVEPGSLYLSDDEARILRKYLLNGGFLWLDDFWGNAEWENMASQMKKVLSDRDFTELPLTHPLYHCVFDIKSKDQIPGIDHWMRSGGGTSERYDSQEVHHRAIFDDKGRIMVLATHDTDNGDGWEREGDNHEYYQRFSEKTAYPLAINVIFYVMSH